MSNYTQSSLDIQEAQRLFYELLDQWTPCHEAVRELRSKVFAAFSGVNNGSTSNPSLGILTMLESLESKERELQTKMDEVIKSLKH